MPPLTATPQQRFSCDVLIIGSGIAGLTAALTAAKGAKVTVITKELVTACNTMWAQGGICCVMAPEDSFEQHIQDTLKSGGGLCKEDVVRHIVEAAPARIQDLLDLGVRFTTIGEIEEGADPLHAGDYDLGKEGGHSQRRVLHAGDVTGEEVIRAMHAACRAHPNITIHEHRQAVDLICTRRLGFDGPNICQGAYVLDRTTNTVHTYLAKSIMLATGGAGKVYLYTSNPDVACGEGIAMAYRNYAEIANMEFYQFHPTILHHPQAKSFLISEAVRGEGGILKAKRGNQYVEFMDDYHELGSLATRDVVARAIDRELKKSGHPCVYIDIRHHDEAYLRRRFPTIFDTCLQVGINMAKDPIPVVPAAHYCCGGVRADVHGVTCVQNLYAVGEVSCTGLHGANRLASNSLLEGLVCGHNAALHSLEALPTIDCRHFDDTSSRRIPDWSVGSAVDADELIVIYHNWDEIRRFMWDYVGIFRTTKRLLRAKARIRNIRKEIELFYWDFTITPDLVELRNMASVAEMIIDCALERKECVGLHFNADCQEALDPSRSAKETILRRPGFAKELH